MTLGNEKARNKNTGGILFFLSVFCLCIAALAAFWDFSGVYAFEATMKNAQEIGVYDPIEIDFSQPVLLIDKSNIKISPEIGFFYELSTDRQKLFIVPAGTLDYEKKYEVALEGVRGILGNAIDAGSFTFYTKEEKPGGGIKVADAKSPETESEAFGTMALSKDKYVPPEKSAVTTAYHPQAHITEGKYIDVSISKQVMTLFADGNEVNQFKVSTGKVGMPTPLGRFSVKSKEKNHWSVKYKLWMPYSLNFNGPYYIHELPYWPNGYREGEAHLGRRVSHGCVRLGIGPAEYVFNWVDIGTPVYIHQ